MSMLDELVGKYGGVGLEEIFNAVGIASNLIHPVSQQALKEVTLAQWLLESARATSKLAIEAYNFSGLKWRDEMKGFAASLSIKVPSEPVAVEFCQFQDIDSFLVGYWKFLTRSPYKGLEDHTKTPETFIGFLVRQGFAADPGYVTKVLKLLPEAQQLLANANRINSLIQPLPAALRISRIPQEVEVGQSFRVEGIASPTDAGKTLLIEVDEQFKTKGALIDATGSWRFDFVLNQAGDRKIEVSTNNETVSMTVRAIETKFAADEPDTQTPSGSIVINLIGSVGRGGVNHSEDVKKVKNRLRELGFTWIGTSNSIDTGTIQAIRLFQSIIVGESNVLGDGRVDLGGLTHSWLQASNAPRWQIMPTSAKANGFINFELGDTSDNHDFGTDWLARTILAAAQDYQQTHRNANPSATPLVINNVSLPVGGDTPTHAGHETGLMCDVLLARKDGDFGGITFRDAIYDRQAMRAIIHSIRRQKLVRAVFFNDPTLIAERLCSFVAGHDNHVHFEINPPVKK